MRELLSCIHKINDETRNLACMTHDIKTVVEEQIVTKSKKSLMKREYMISFLVYGRDLRNTCHVFWVVLFDTLIVNLLVISLCGKNP